ncbi:hypothetical protein BDZ97DRAFT_2074588 [Flammula alnicola]|nr:hypothetical protein BDZ97DRAFT_2074588 [Flammula alnicola]
MSSTAVGTSLIPGKDTLLELQLVGTLLSAIAYGLVLSLFIHCFALLASHTKHSYTRRMQAFLIIYVVVMFLLSTTALVQGLVYITRAFFHGFDSASHRLTRMNEPVSLPIAVLGADGFMLWRCLVLYQDTTRLHRVILFTVLCLTSLTSIGCAILFYLTAQVTTLTLASPLIPTIITASLTTFANLIFAILIAGRLYYHQETMRRVLGSQYGSPYRRVIAIDEVTFNGCIIPLLLLPHICVISPLLIVYQVAKGKSASSVRPSHIITPNIAGINEEAISKPIQFNNPTSTVFSQQDMPTHEERHVKMGSKSPASSPNPSVTSFSESQV